MGHEGVTISLVVIEKRIKDWMIEQAGGNEGLITKDDFEEVWGAFETTLAQEGLYLDLEAYKREFPDEDEPDKIPREGRSFLDDDDAVSILWDSFSLLDDNVEVEHLKKSDARTNVRTAIANDPAIGDVLKVIKDYRGDTDKAEKAWIAGIQEQYKTTPGIADTITSTANMKAARDGWRALTTSAPLGTPLRKLTYHDYLGLYIEPTIRSDGVIGFLVDIEELEAHDMLKEVLAGWERLPDDPTPEWLTNFSEQKRLLTAALENRRINMAAIEKRIDALPADFAIGDLAALDAPWNQLRGTLPELIASHAANIPTVAELTAQSAAKAKAKERADQMKTEGGRRALFEAAARRLGVLHEGITDIELSGLEATFQEVERQVRTTGQDFDESVQEALAALDEGALTEKARATLTATQLQQLDFEKWLGEQNLTERQKEILGASRGDFLTNWLKSDTDLGFEAWLQGPGTDSIPDMLEEKRKALLTPLEQAMEQFREAAGPPPGGFDPVETAEGAIGRLEERLGPNIPAADRKVLRDAAAQRVQDALTAINIAQVPGQDDDDVAAAEELQAAQDALSLLNEQDRQRRNELMAASSLFLPSPGATSPARTRLARALATGDPDILRAALDSEGVSVSEEMRVTFMEQQKRQFAQGAASSGVSGESQQSVLAIGAEREPRIGVNLTEHTRTFVNEKGVTVTEPLKELEEGEEGPGILRRTAAQEEEFGGVVPEPAAPPAASVPTLAEQVALDEAEAEHQRLLRALPPRLGGSA